MGGGCGGRGMNMEEHSKMLEMETKKSAFVADLSRVLKKNMKSLT